MKPEILNQLTVEDISEIIDEYGLIVSNPWPNTEVLFTAVLNRLKQKAK